MPFIDCKITKVMTSEEKEELKTELGSIISLLNKPEEYLMIGIADGYDMYFGGEKMEEGAFIDVKLFGRVNSGRSVNFTVALCDILKRQLGLDPKQVYITYQGIVDWGHNSTNF